MTLDSPTSEPTTRRPDRWAILAIALLAIAVRVWHMEKASVWFDEIASLQLSTAHGPGDVESPKDVIHPDGMEMTRLENARPWSQLNEALSIDTHPPLYSAILRLWRGIFGPGDRAARSLSLICSIASILVLYDTVRMLQGKPAALWAAALMTIATPQIFFAQETRSYSMLTLLLLAVIREIARAEVRNVIRVVPLAVLTLAAAMTHYLAIPAELGLGLFVLLRFRGSLRVRTLSSMAVAGVAFLLICGPLLMRQRGNFSQNLEWLSDDSPGLMIRTLWRLGILPLQYFIAPSNRDSRNIAMVILGALFYLLIPIAFLRRKDLLIWVAPLAAIIGFTAISDLLQQRRSLSELRMTVAAAPMLYAMVAGITSSFPRRWMRHALPAGIIACCTIFIPDAYELMPKPGDYRRLAAEFDRAASADDLLVVPHESVPIHWGNSMALSGLTHYSAHPNRPVLPLSGPASEATLEQLRTAPAGVWFFEAELPKPIDPWIPGASIEKSVHVFGTATISKLRFPTTREATSAPSESSPASQSSR